MNTIKRIILVTIFSIIFAGFAVLAYVIQKSQDPETQLKRILVNEDTTIAKAFFSPDDDVKSLLVNLINAEKKSICIAIYTITEKEIAQALVHAHNQGVKVEVIVDRSYGADRYSKIPYLANHKVPIWVYQQTQLDPKTTSIMHDKFCVFEDNITNKSIIWTGSYNFTKRASEQNQENVVVLDNKKIIEQFIKQFNILKSRSLLISGHPCSYNTVKTTEKNRNSEGTVNAYFKRWVAALLN